MPVDNQLKKVMIIGSGPITIGQAAEFDYSGTQACKAIMEEGIETILVNSNPATIMTDSNIADRVYIEPLTIESLESIIKSERPDGILAGFGGQTSLNLAIALDDASILAKYNVSLLGMKKETIIKAEDRDSFKNLMLEIDEPIANSIIATTLDECKAFVDSHGYPVIIRPAYTLGGTGGGIATNYDELLEICARGIKNSPISQILLEQSVAGWKEIEYEVIRDKKDNCIIICNMENMDPVGVHTGDSIVVAPSQTLRDKEYQMLRHASIKIIRSLDIEGGCNIQFALDPKSSKYIVIEVNPRVSRSSALASKAVGYPIAKISAKLSIGYSLDELKNSITKTSSACFEPALDYVVVKFPKWPFDKFAKGERTLGTQMKATGEVMSMSRSFEAALLKAVSSLDRPFNGLRMYSIMGLDNKDLKDKIELCDDERIFALSEALRRGITIDELHNLTMIDKWFLSALMNIVDMENRISDKELDTETYGSAKSMGFTDREIADLSGLAKEQVQGIGSNSDIKPVFKMVDTCSGEFDAVTPYYYSCYDLDNENTVSDKESIAVIGSGPIRIGQGIEFDYCCVHGVWGIKDNGYESIMINNNPETVSTDFDTADKLFFESLHIDSVMHILTEETPKGIILQFGGQTSINLAKDLHDRGVNILGTPYDSIDLAEDRDRFNEFLNSLDIPSPSGQAIDNIDHALDIAKRLGYPLVVRPSYVIGGRAMQVVYNDSDLIKYINEAIHEARDTTILIDKYIEGIEIEVDAICDGTDILIPGIMEHVEKTGVHSGDSIAVYPPYSLGKDVIDTLVKYTRRISTEMGIIGLINIQYVYDGRNIYVIEVNPRASRTVPILSKVTSVPMVRLAVDAMLGKKLRDSEYGVGLMDSKGFYAVKHPVFSAEKLDKVDMHLGPEMKSTGEVLGVSGDFNEAIYKGFKGTGVHIPTAGQVYISVRESDKKNLAPLVKGYIDLGFEILASAGTYDYITDNGMRCTKLDTDNLESFISEDKIDIIINTPTTGSIPGSKGYELRRLGIMNKIPTFTSLDTAKIFIDAIVIERNNESLQYKSLDKYFKLSN